MNTEKLALLLFNSKSWFLKPEYHIIGCYLPMLSESISDSLVNKANPGTYDLTGDEPIQSRNFGWYFNGSKLQYLNTGIVPTDDQQMTMIVWFGGLSIAGQYLITMRVAGASGANANQAFSITPNLYNPPVTVYYANGSTLQKTPGTSSGILAVSGATAFRNGIAETGAIASWGDAIEYPIYIGARNNQGTVQNPVTGYIRAAVICDSALSEDRILEITNRLNETTYKDILLWGDYSQSGLTAARNILIDAIWPDGSGFPTEGVTVDTGVVSPLTTQPSNLDHTDSLTVDMGGGQVRVSYVWYPTYTNNKLVVHQYGHIVPNFEGSNQGDYVRGLVEAGYTVLGVQMPPSNHNDFPDPTPTLNPIRYYVEPTIRCLNEIASGFTNIYLSGHSGGAWAVSVIAALDTRPTKSAFNEGVQSLSIFDNSRDYEQYLPGIFPTLEYTDLMVMGTSGGRQQLQTNIEDSGFFDKTPYDDNPYGPSVIEQVEAPGSWELRWDSSVTVHQFSPWAQAEVMQFWGGTILFQPAETTGLDTQISAASGAETSNYGITAAMTVGNHFGVRRSLLQFTLPAYLTGKTVTSATVRLYCEGEAGVGDYGIRFHRALTQWYEGIKNGAQPTGENGSTWNLRNANGAVAWGAVGGQSGTDYTASPTVSTTVTGTGFYDFDVTADVNAWLGGANNYGWFLINADESTEYTRKNFTSSSGATAANRPRLTIVY